MPIAFLAISYVAVYLATPANAADPTQQLLALDASMAAALKDKGWYEVLQAYFDKACNIYEPEIYVMGGGEQYPPHYVRVERDHLSWTPQHATLSADASMGFTSGEWSRETEIPPWNDRELTRGHYVHIWRKNAAGQWKVVVDIAEIDTPQHN